MRKSAAQLDRDLDTVLEPKTVKLRQAFKMTTHSIRFPRHDVDIHTQKRTLLHLPLLPDGDPDARITWNVGDTLLLCGHPNFPRAMVTGVSSVSEVRLLDMTTDDLVKLNVSPDEAGRVAYLERWDEVNPSELAESNPRVLRIEFNYNYAKVGDSVWALGT